MIRDLWYWLMPYKVTPVLSLARKWQVKISPVKNDHSRQKLKSLVENFISYETSYCWMSTLLPVLSIVITMHVAPAHFVGLGRKMPLFSILDLCEDKKKCDSVRAWKRQNIVEERNGSAEYEAEPPQWLLPGAGTYGHLYACHASSAQWSTHSVRTKHRRCSAGTRDIEQQNSGLHSFVSSYYRTLLTLSLPSSQNILRTF